MFQFPTFPSYTLLYSCMDKSAFTWFEFPHSDIHGSKDICSLPWLFAAYHVLLRLLVPRYPPYALCSLTLNPWKTSSCFISLSKFFLDVLMYYLVKFCSWNKPILVFDVFFLLKHYSFWSVILKLPFWIVFWFFRFNRSYYLLNSSRLGYTFSNL